MSAGIRTRITAGIRARAYERGGNGWHALGDEGVSVRTWQGAAVEDVTRNVSMAEGLPRDNRPRVPGIVHTARSVEALTSVKINHRAAVETERTPTDKSR